MNGLVSHREDVQAYVLRIPKNPNASTEPIYIRAANIFKPKVRANGIRPVSRDASFQDYNNRRFVKMDDVREVSTEI